MATHGPGVVGICPIPSVSAGGETPQIVNPFGRPDYLACMMRELLPMAPSFDEIVLLYDRELEAAHHSLEASWPRAARPYAASFWAVCRSTGGSGPRGTAAGSGTRSVRC